MLRAWTTTLCIASTLLFACGDDDGGGGDTGDTGDSSGTDAAVGGSDSGGGGSDGSTDNADAAGGGDFMGIPCAGDTCQAGTEVCCAGEGGLTCEATCDTVSFACDGPEDCTGDNICCGSGADGTICATAADCGAGDGDVICHTADDCPEAGQECCMPPQADVGTCRNHCPGA